MLGGMLTQLAGGGATWKAKATSAVTTTPTRMAPGKRRKSSAKINRNPKIDTSTGPVVIIAGAHRRARRPQPDDAGFVQPDESEK